MKAVLHVRIRSTRVNQRSCTKVNFSIGSGADSKDTAIVVSEAFCAEVSFFKDAKISFRKRRARQPGSHSPCTLHVRPIELHLPTLNQVRLLRCQRFLRRSCIRVEVHAGTRGGATARSDATGLAIARTSTGASVTNAFACIASTIRTPLAHSNARSGARNHARLLRLSSLRRAVAP